MRFDVARLAVCGTAAALLFSGCSGGGTSLPAAGSAQAPSPLTPQSSVRRTADGGAFVVDPRTGRAGPFAVASSAGTPETSPGWLSADAIDARVAKAYVSDETAGAVYIFKTADPSKPVGTITNGLSGPLGSFIDSKGTLYVTNINSNSVTVYPRGATKPSLTYTKGLSLPVSVAVGTDGTVYVSEFEPGSVVEYDKGATKPSRTIAINEPEGVTLDAKNALYVSYNSASTGAGGVEKFAPKATKGKDLGLTGVQFTGDLRINTAGDLLVGDQGANTVDFFKPGATSAYGTISAVHPYKFAFNASEALVYVATASTTVDIFDAVPNGKMTGSITDGLQSATGVSLSPPAAGS